MKLNLSLLSVVILFAALGATAQERTIINDKSAAQMLLGKHRLSLQWISWDRFGTATVTNRAAVYSVKGEQKGRGNIDYVRIDGMIVSIDSKQFVFEGSIVTRISHINGGEPCTRQGDFTFRITGKRKYWRLMEMDNPCDTATDYVDIYFR